MILVDVGFLPENVQDCDQTVELLPVFFRLGIFSANATIREKFGQINNIRWTSFYQHGILPARSFGYALALFALMRGEQSPDWANYLRPDAVIAFRSGLRYLQKTGDSLFHPETIRSPRPRSTPQRLVERLQSGTPTFRLATLWEIGHQPVSDRRVVRAITECLVSRDPAISASAGLTLASIGPAAAEAVPDLVEALSARHDDTRLGAARALGHLHLQPELLIPELSALLASRIAR